MSGSTRELPIPEVETLLEMCRFRAGAQPSEIAYTYLVDGETEEQNLTYSQLDRAARQIAARLIAAGCTGGRALLLYPAGLEYISAFYGCVYAGVTAVPLYPPDPLRMDRTLPRLQAVCEDAEAAAMLGTASSLAWVRALDAPIKTVRTVLATDALEPSDDDRWEPPTLSGDSLAFLQYTSGSTGTPRGVMVSHANLLYNVRGIDRGESQGVTGVTWLPMYHDFGLVGAVLLPMYAGRRTISMSPLAFMQRPMRWMEAISRYGGTITGAPNFAYELCARTALPDELARLDLSTLSIALNGAEPVRRETLDRFTATFAPCGFNPNAFVPCYGLAEATLGVSGGDYKSPYVIGEFCAAELEENKVVPAAATESNRRVLAACGPALCGSEIVIVDPHTCYPRQADEVGEVWVRGPGIANGYWNRPEETAATFHACLADSGRGPYLRTGDLGFLHEGELYITGRLKDLIIICGRNHYPQDIERTVVASHPTLKADAGAAFSVDRDGAERLVIVQEITRPNRLDLDQVVQTIRAAVLASHDLAVDAVVLIKAGTIGKTTSGKIRRRSCRDEYLQDRLAVVHQWRAGCNAQGLVMAREPVAPRTDTERALLELWREVLRTEELGVHDNFFDYGGHSLLASQLAARIAAVFSVSLPLSELFAAPTVAALAQVVERYRDSRPHTALAPIERIDRTADACLSFGQQRLWFVDQWLSGSPVNNLCTAVRFRSAFSTTAMRESVAEIARRHESLRTTFVTVDGSPHQHIAAEIDTPFSEVDLTGLSAADSDTEARRIADREARRPYDLAAGPLWHVTVVRLQAGEQEVILALHHIISDGWSIAVLLRELLLVYEAFAEGRPSPLGALDFQYRDFAAYQRHELNDASLSQQLDYWRTRLGDAPAVLSLPTDRPRPAVQTFRGDVLPVELPATLSHALEELSRSEGTTLFMTVLAAYQVLLGRYASQTDVSVGTAVAHRMRPEFEGLIGFFVNSLVMRGDLSGDPTFRELLARTRQTALGAYEHQDVPFERLVEEFAPRRALSHSPLYQAAFVLQNMPVSVTAKGSDFRCVHNGTARHDVTLTLWQDAGRLVGEWEYNSDLFDAATIEHMLASFKTLLIAAVTSPDQPISRLALLSAQERQRIIAYSAGVRAPFDDTSCLHELFERHAERNPAAVALEFGGRTMTYCELNERANQLARHLHSRGVGPDVLVGLCLDRSFEMIVGIMGILKAGGAYVPLDPCYPAARLDFIIRDAQLSLVVTSAATHHILAGHAVQSACVDVESAAIAAESTENVQRLSNPENLAYVIYTSGSTGQPKGVLIEHRGACNFIAEAKTWFVNDSVLRVLQFASSNFDASVVEIFGALSVGATLCLGDETELAPGPALAHFLTAHHISFALLPPSAVAMLPCEPLPELTHLVVGGEACSPKLVDLWAPGRWMINGYGPTEVTVGASKGECRSGEERQPPIGRPFANVQVYLLDSHGELVPQGMPGEIYIGGAGVARGYLNRPELTAERFVSDRFGGGSGKRLYRSGDVGRLRADGQLEFLGRLDHQVKVRGFRIELGEIEAALAAHPAVRDVAVVVRGEHADDKRLVAYFATAQEPTPTTSELHQYLKQQLPDYMIPSAFVALAALPITANGKIDRAALPAVDRSRPTLSAEYVAPRTETEAALERIWSEVIGLERVGIHDNFFELGGDSLLSMQVIARAARVGLKLTPRQLFEQQTIAEQAAVAIAAEADTTEQGAVSGAVELTPIQRWFFDQQLEAAEHFNQSIMLEIDERLNPALLEAAVAHLVAHHDALRLRFTPHAAGWAQSNAAAETGSLLRFVELAGMSSADVQKSIEGVTAELHAGMNLATGPLVRVALFDCGAAHPCRLLFVAHHLVVDGVSWRILLEDLHTVYQQLLRGESPCLSAKSTSYQEWARRLTAYASDPTLREELATWVALTADAGGHLPLDIFATNGSAENGHVALGHNGASHAGNGHATNGHTNGHSNGHTTNGHSTNGHSGNGHATNGHAVNGHAANGHSNGHATNGYSNGQSNGHSNGHHNANGHVVASQNGHTSSSCDAGTVASARTISISLSVEETRRLLEEAPRAYRAGINTILLTALAQAFHHWTHDASLLVELEGHGREDMFDGVDLSRTVGWFTCTHPVQLTLDAHAGSCGAVAAIEAQLARIPQRGIGYGILKYLCSDPAVAAEIGQLPQPSVMFNYLGQVDQMFGVRGPLRLVREATGLSRSPRHKRSHLLEINGLVSDGRLHFEWTYSESRHHRATIERVAADFKHALGKLLEADDSATSGGASPMTAYVAPRSALESELTELCEKLAGHAPIGVEDDLSSFDDRRDLALACLTSFAGRHRLDLPISEAGSVTTIADMAQVVRRAAARLRRSPIVPIRRTGTRPILFCVHPSGGSVFPYYALAHHLGPDQPVYALEARGLARHEECHATVEAMARDYIDAVRAVQPEGPYYLAGWSFGGLVVYEMASQLTRAGEKVALVTLIDSKFARGGENVDVDDAFARLLAMFPGVERLPTEQMRSLPRADRLSLFARQVTAAGLVQPGAERGEIERLYEVFEANCQAWTSYRPPEYAGEVTFFRAREQHQHDDGAFDAGWNDCVVGSLRIRTVQGDHLTMMREPHVRRLAQDLRRQLDVAAGRQDAALARALRRSVEPS